MRKLLLPCLLLSSISLISQIIYPGTPTTGTAETVFDYSVSKCHADDLPDAPARAFRNAAGKINLLASHYTSWRMTGSTFSALSKNCTSVMDSHLDSDPSKFNNKEWISSTYTTDGINIHALIHEEYVPCGDWNTCWYNAITYASSADSGKTYTHTTAPSHLVAASPYQSPYPTTHVPFGIFGGSNIIEKDGYYYKLVQLEAYKLQDYGVGVLRTTNLSDPTSWRGWDGTGYNVTFVNPYTATGYTIADKILAPVSRDVIGKMCASLTFNTYFNKFMVVDYTVGEINGQLKYGFYYSLSDDLINWTAKRIIYQFNSSTWVAGGLNYPSIIDHDDVTRNFERPDQTVYLYYTKWNSGLDRDLMRMSVTFNKETATEFVVNSTTDLGDATPGDGICKTTGNVCSLRAAIEEANARPPYDGYDTVPLPINFLISGTGVKTITPTTYLPEIFYPLYINGYGQTGASVNTNNFNQGLNTAIKIVINAEDGGTHALAFHCGNNTVKGLSVINGNIDFLFEDGYSKSSDYNTVEGCFVGMGSNGTTSYPGAINFNNQDYNTVGGTSNASRNLIGGGVIVTNSDYNSITNNYFGTDYTGNASSNSTANSIEINDSSAYNSIGGSLSSEINLISAGNRGVILAGANCEYNEILGNYIGVARDGMTALGNNSAGITLNSNTHHNTIGSPGAGNVISDNSADEAGIWMDNAHDNTIQSNYIGTDATLTAYIGNGDVGNFSGGIVLKGSGSYNNTIGGLTANQGNIIANNSSHGIAIFSDAGDGNAMLSNLIYNNEEMGIDISADDSPNTNDNLDSDSGPNGSQNFPVFTNAVASSSAISFFGTLNSKASGTYTVQYFYNSNCDASGNGEGEVLIGSENVTTNASGNGTLAGSFSVVVPVGAFVSALATDANNNTSEFSVCQEVEVLTNTVEVNSLHIKVYPKLASEFITVTSDELCNYTLSDEQGKIVKTGKTDNQKSILDVSDLNPGIYFITLNGISYVETQKIVKQ